MDMHEKVRENRLRRVAARQGLELRRSPRRSKFATSYGTYALYNSHDGTIEANDGHPSYEGFGLFLDEVESILYGATIRTTGDVSVALIEDGFQGDPSELMTRFDAFVQPFDLAWLVRTGLANDDGDHTFGDSSWSIPAVIHYAENYYRELLGELPSVLDK